MAANILATSPVPYVTMYNHNMKQQSMTRTTFFVSHSTGKVKQWRLIFRSSAVDANANGVWHDESEKEVASCGKEIIPIGSVLRADQQNGVCFFLQTGCIRLIVFNPTDASQAQTSIVTEGDHFYIPASNSFRIENCSEIAAELFYTVRK